MKRNVMSHNHAPKLDTEVSGLSQFPNYLFPSAPQPWSPKFPSAWPFTDLRSFFSSCSSQSLLSWGAWGARVTSLPHGPGFSCCSLRKRQNDSKLRPSAPSLPKEATLATLK